MRERTLAPCLPALGFLRFTDQGARETPPYLLPKGW